MIDANECICNQDIDLLNYSVNIGIPVIIVINKCDMISSIKKKRTKKNSSLLLKKIT
ncbi:hypothetical protein HIC20_00720 [Buchnera aphidicola (Hormaphis cornu)]|nr:hypothetical protein HIC20_00720 [Buchnera aphidicola (Hormaphis cornu)]